MTITLTVQEDQELWEETAERIPPLVNLNAGSTMKAMPKPLGEGYDLFFQLYPDCYLKISSHQYREDLQIKLSEGRHPVELGVILSGMSLDSQEVLDNEHTLISGSGMRRQMSSTCLSNQPHLTITLAMAPGRLATFFPNEHGELPDELSFLVKGNDWQTLMYPKTNPAIQQVAHEIIYCPYQGAGQRMFLQGKSHELITLMLAPIVADQGNPKPPSRMKPTTIAQIHAARDLLRLRLEDPPSSLQLAQQVGLSDRTLQKGFQSLFGTTVFGYLTEQRLIWAAQQLRETHQTVSEVANLVGYANPAKFTAVFKRKFGMTPSECAKGKKINGISVLE